MKKQTLSIRSLIMLFVAWIGINTSLLAQVSVTATSGTTGPTTYTTVNAAFTAINAGTHQGDILITVTANTTEPATPVQLLRSGAGSSAYQSVKIMPSGNVTINSATTPTAGRGILEFIGADFVTIDGDDPSTGGVRNLSIQMATTTNASTACIRFSSSTATSDGCSNATVKNCNITGGRSSAVVTTASYGIYSGLSSATATITTATGAADNDSMLIENNAIQRCYYGIYAYGIATYLMDNLVIRNNAIGSNVQANNVGLRGIYVANTQTTASANSLLIEGNDIQGGDTLTGWSATIAGIDLNVSNAGAIIRNNNIHNVEQPSTGGWGAYGLFISSATNNANIHIYNNFIRDIRAFHYTTGFNQYHNYGIYSTVAVTNLRINNNTIVLAKPNNGTGTANFSACVALSSTATPVIEFKNNIIVNKQSDNTGQTCTGFYIGGAATLNNAAVNSNAYYVTGASGFVGSVGGTNYASLPTWRTATNRDSNSFFVEPSFVSSTNLHLTTGVKSILESNGLTITGYNTDFDGQARPGPTGSVYGGGFNFDIGADEADLPPDNFGYDSSSVTQISGVIPAGTNNNALLRIKVSVSGSVGTPVNLSNIYFNTIGSTTPTDIIAAKVYYTGSNSTFSASSQYGSTVSSPNGQFAVSGAQSLAAGVNYFWLSYDVSLTAANNNLVDARLDSFIVDGIGKIPVNNNPAGSLQIALPMTYVSSTSEHVDLTKVETGSTNNRLLRVFIKTSTSGAPVNLTQLNLNTNGGGDDTSNINNIKVYYTGSNPNFSAINQFGSTFIQTTPVGSSWGAFSINGIRALQNDSNFFWVTYDIKTAAILGDSVDAECTGFTFGTTPYTPTITAPIGNRLIRSPYCPSAATSPGDEEIWNVTIGSLNNTSTCTTAAPGPGSVTAMYSNYTISVAAPNIPSGVPVPFSVNTASCGGNYNSSLGVYIDYNQNGIFDLPGEMAYSNNTFTSSTVGAQIISGNITVPCTALGGLTRMRVVLVETTAGTTPCGTYTWGETEDYSVNIVTGAASYSASNAIQFTGTTSSGATNVKILRVPVKVFSSPCNPGVITELRFNTAGSTSAADISNAKLYKTGNSNVFSVANLVGTANSPSGQFTFSVTDTAVNDTNNYWLAYDVSASATSTNVLDARVDSILVFGNWFVPTNNAPTGNLVITNPMTYIGSSATHPDLSMAESPSTNARMLRAMVVMSSSGAPVSVTQLSLDATGGGDDTSNIANVKVFYTGNSANFASTNQFGLTFVQTTPTGNKYGAFNINGIVNLLNDTNYFWVTYDIKSTAILGDSVDAEITGITIGGVNQAPTNSAPSGNRRIRAQYCPSYATSVADEEIWNVTFGTLNNTSTCATTAPGAGSVNTVYSNYTTSVAAPNIPIGVPVPFSVNTASCGGNYNSSLGIYIDYNQNGIFDLPGEVAYTNNAFTSSNTGAQIVSGNITIPCTAMGGNTRMRVVLVETTTGTTPCGTYTWGETEDYTINIVAGAATFTNATAIQITGSTSAGSLDVPVLRVPLKVFASPCNPALITNFRFNTAGTTSAGDIVSAKLYKTGASGVFSTATLLGSLPSPSGMMEFIIADTAVNDTNNYWLAYDVSTLAATNNVLDARFDSIEVFGEFKLPIAGNPTGNVLISNPVVPTLTTVAASNLTTTTGTIGGAVTFNGFATITGTGVVYSTTPNPVRFGTGVVDSASVVAVPTGNFTFNVDGLTHSTKYYYRAYAINSVGTGYSVQDSFTTTPIISSLPYSQNFESGAGGWTSALTSTNSAVNWIIGFATNNNWVLGTPAKTYLNGARSGTKAWVTKLTGTYDIDHDASILSPQFNFASYTNDPVVRFSHKFKAESDWDGLIVEMSINNGYWRRVDSAVGTGSNYNTAISYAWYNDNINYVSSGGVLAPPYFSNDIGSGSVYSSQDSGWIQSAFRLAGAAGQTNVRVRFRFISDTYVVDEGWALDDIEVVDIVTPTVASSSVSASSAAATTMNVSWTSGNGNARLVVARLNATSAVAPTNNTLYTANAAFGGTSTTGTGNFVVYNGTGTSVTVTGLAASTQYAFDVYEYNGKYMHNMFAAAATGGSTTLPVSWLSFSGFANGENVDLIWVTAQEINNKGFEIERSKDGINFENVGFVKGAGTYNGKVNYAFVDAGILASTPVVYYRLKQIDFDGKFEYSSTVVVRNNMDAANEVKVYPNPFKESVSIELRNATELSGTATLIDIQGRVVKSISLNLDKGFGAFEMGGLDELKDGIYFVKVNIGGQYYQEKLVKVGK